VPGLVHRSSEPSKLMALATRVREPSELSWMAMSVTRHMASSGSLQVVLGGLVRRSQWRTASQPTNPTRPEVNGGRSGNVRCAGLDGEPDGLDGASRGRDPGGRFAQPVGLAAAGGEGRPGLGADERIPRPDSPAGGRFHQERARPAVGQPPVHPDGRVGVGQDLHGDRNDPAVRGQAAELLEGGADRSELLHPPSLPCFRRRCFRRRCYRRRCYRRRGVRR
jgi:hypothetical protein